MGVMIMMSYLTMKVTMTMTMKTAIPGKALVIKCCFASDEVELVTGKNISLVLLNQLLRITCVIRSYSSSRQVY